MSITNAVGFRYKLTMGTYFAKGDDKASLADEKFIVPDSKTGTPGINFKLLGFGVSMV